MLQRSFLNKKLKKMLSGIVTLTSISLAISAATVESAHAALISRQTTFDAASGEKILFDWSYDSSAERDGVVDIEELEDWSWSFFWAGGDLFSTEFVWADGFNAQTRWWNGEPDLKFDSLNSKFVSFNTAGSAFYEDGYFSLEETNGGEVLYQYGNYLNVYNVPDGIVNIVEWTEGPTTRSGETGTMESTPEPTTVIGLITLGGVMLGSKRKTKG